MPLLWPQALKTRLKMLLVLQYDRTHCLPQHRKRNMGACVQTDGGCEGGEVGKDLPLDKRLWEGKLQGRGKSGVGGNQREGRIEGVEG